MAKLNRIGNKLGAAGLLGILLAGGMLANQMISEAAITRANERATAQSTIAEHTLEANVAVRRMQLSVRDVRLSSTAPDVEKHAKALNDAYERIKKELGISISLMVRPENKARLERVAGLADQYAKAASELAETQLKIFQVIGKRAEFTAHWSKTFDSAMSSPALAAAPNRFEIEKLLWEASSMFNAMRAATWRFAATGDENQKRTIETRSAGMTSALGRAAKAVSDSKELSSLIEALSADAKANAAATAEAIKLEAVKKDLVEVQTLPRANQAIELMREAVDVAEKRATESQAEAAAQLAQSNRISFVASVAVILSLIGAVIFTFVGVARPLSLLNGALGRLAGGELNVEIPGADRGDEVGDIAKTVVVIGQNAEQKAREEAAAQAEQERRAAQQRKADMVKMADDFEGAVGEIVDTVSSASTELEASASTLTATAERAQELTTAVAAASEEASTNVQSVASATEELTSSVVEISRQVQESARIANDAVGQARRTNERVADLSRAASRIGDVVELINTIAGQTNLLALNATIEAARAGEAGRGFAVVASEVKALAEQTAKATGEIGQQIDGIQRATQDSVGAIKEISGTIEKLSEISATIASAVEEQGAATQEISRNVQQAAQGTQEVSSNITDVQRGASETGSASSQVFSAARSLSSDSNRLKLEVGKFLNTVRSA
ncbi:MAG TPA: methyl-accepting chemotaxis protein [Bradyrhizobium sp.]|nr:methyl-accepting chemotaxis protein [Bradyrhizobium sp.]